MTPPDFTAIAREWISYCLARTEPWTEDEEAAALAERFRSVHEAGVREAAEAVSTFRGTIRTQYGDAKDAVGDAEDCILALLPEPKP